MREEPTRYLDGEGRDFMQECMVHAIAECMRLGLDKLVIYTGTGDGPRHAAEEFLTQAQYGHLRVIAVTPPVGKTFYAKPGDTESPIIRAGIHPAVRDDLEAMGIRIVSAHLPFQAVHTGTERASEWERVVAAYGVLGGGFAYCIQAVLVACDSGLVEEGERVVVMSADTALVTSACRTESFLAPTDGMLVEHIVCRPMRYDISKREHRFAKQMWSISTDGETVNQIAAPQEPLALASNEEEASTDDAD